MAKGPAKITVACPSCGATQQESEHAKSTFCRKCGKHIELAKSGGAAHALQKSEGPGLIDRLTRFLHRETVRHVNCLHCNAAQTVSSQARSGSCVQCGHYLDFRDIKVDGIFSKSIETHGTITVAKNGEITSPKVACAAAIVFGKINGNLVCSTTARVRTKGRVLGSIQARLLIIEKKADVEFVRPLHVGEGKSTAKSRPAFSQTP
jgi:cytoskeletal protein CcmA (bactofilin family)